MALTVKYPSILFFSGVGVLFAALSIFLILRVHHIRQTVEGHVATINTLSRLEAETFSILSAIDKDPGPDVIKKINILITYPSVPADAVDFSNLKAAINNPQNSKDRTHLAGELSLIKKSCQYAIGENRQQLRLNSEKLLNYWNYTHALLILASLALLALPVAIYRITKAKHRPL